MSRNLKALAVLVAGIATSASAFGQFTTVPGYSATSVYSDSAGPIGSIDAEGTTLYVGGNATKTVVSLTPPSGTTTTVGTVASASFTDFSTIFRSAGVTYAAYGTSFSSPYPYNVGPSVAGSVTTQATINGVYDSARNAAGAIYLSAAPTAGNTQILQYNPLTGSTQAVANIGGFSGGLTFNSAGDLFYAGGSSVLRFTAAELAIASLPAATPLTVADADAVVPISAGYLGFNAAGQLYATTGFGAGLALYDTTTGAKISDIATGSGATSIGQIRTINGTLYTNVTDYGSFSGTIYAIVPEPAGLSLLTVAGLFARRRVR